MTVVKRYIEGDVDITPIKFQIARLIQSVRRCYGRQFVDRLFADVKSPLILSRSFASLRLHLDVSRSVFHQLLYLEGERLIAERFLLRSLVMPGTRVIDVGANIGYYALLLRQFVGASGEIICIEPSPENLIELRRNVTENKLTNVRIVEAAVGARAGVVGLKAGINSGVVEEGEGPYMAPISPLDEIVDGRVDFIKVDVDGYEAHVLAGARETLERHRPNLFLEFHPELVGRHGASFDGVQRMLEGIYGSLEYHFVPDCTTWWEKVKERYLGCDMVEMFDPQVVAVDRLHVGRMFGTFWIVCRRTS